MGGHVQNQENQRVDQHGASQAMYPPDPVLVAVLSVYHWQRLKL